MLEDSSENTTLEYEDEQVEQPQEPTLAQVYQAVGSKYARWNMRYFTRFMRVHYRMQWFHRQMCDALDDLLEGTTKRLMIFCPPQHGKSEVVSRCFPAFALGRNPNLMFAGCSHTADLASRFNRDVQRIIDSDIYRSAFNDVRLNDRNVVSNSQGSWLRNSDAFEIVGHRGRYESIGVGGPLTGKTVDVGVIDDPVKDAVEASSPVSRKRLWEWYTDVFSTRLNNNSRVLLTMCMVGDTEVTMGDGSLTLLRDIRPGDEIATYDGGKVSTSHVVNWANQGPDDVYLMRMSSGITVEANERHPFMVNRDGETQWVQLKNILSGDKIVHVGARIEGRHASPKDVQDKQSAEGFACRTTTRPDGKPECAHRPIMPLTDGTAESSRDTELTRRGMTPCSKSSVADAPCVENLQRQEIRGPTGMGSSVSTTTTIPEKSEGCSATTATLQSDTGKHQKSLNGPLSIYEIGIDTVVSITPNGRKDVFDVQVDMTENFIANGLVSHNTRWHEDDLAGRILAAEAKDWRVLRFRAIKEEDDGNDDPRQVGEALWPDKHSAESILQQKARSQRTFDALYQQRPAPSEGGIIKTDWWKTWDRLPEKFDRVLSSWDLTFKDVGTSWVVGQVWGKVVARVFLIDQVRGKWDFPESVKQIKSLRQRYPQTTETLIEDKANGPAAIATLHNEISGIIPISPKGDKESRVGAISYHIESGNVYIPARASWRDEFIHECNVFPNGANDDMVDAMSQAISRLMSGAPQLIVM